MKKIALILIILLSFSLPVAAGLAGKVIVLNAGHGGGESGAVGLNGLVERDINLKVALYLQDMLKEAGAIVYMTRTENVDLDGTAHYSGTRDRFNRLRVGRETNADIYMALHHNASVNREANQVEVYYMPKYHGPSKELAEFLAKGLSETMELNGIATTMSQIVLNHATIPTIIGEASYISNPTIEEWLRQDENLKKQAEGYFIGLQRFFEAGMPKVEALTPQVNQKVCQDMPIIVAKIQKDGASPIKPTTVQVRIDNKVIPHEYDEASGVVTAKTVEPLHNGAHKLLVIARNEAGIAAVPVDFTFYVDEKPAKIIMDPFPTYVPGISDSVVKISGQVVDKDGQPVMDGNQVYFETVYAGYMAEPWVFTRDGHFTSTVHPTADPDIVGIRIWAGDKLEEIVVDYRSKEFYLFGTVRNSLTGAVLSGMQISLTGADGKVRQMKTDRDGQYFFNELPAGKYQLKMDQIGYQAIEQTITASTQASAQVNLAAEPIAGGVLMGRKIILNAAVEGTTAGAAPVIEALRARLERAGAIVTVVTKGADDTQTVKGTNKLMGNFLLSLKIADSKTAVIYHYPRSEKYAAIAKTLTIAGLEVKAEESRSRLITFANTQSFIVEVPVKNDQAKVVDGLFKFLADYFKTAK